MRVVPIPGSTLSALPRLSSPIPSTSNATVVACLTFLNRSGLTQPVYRTSIPRSRRRPQHQKQTWQPVGAMSALPRPSKQTFISMSGVSASYQKRTSPNAIRSCCRRSCAAGFAQDVGDHEVRCVTTSETGRPFAVAVLRPPSAPDGYGTARDGSEL